MIAFATCIFLVFFLSLGGENLAVAQNTYSVSWFKGKELNMVFGLQLSFSRVVCFMNLHIQSVHVGLLFKDQLLQIHAEKDVFTGNTQDFDQKSF